MTTSRNKEVCINEETIGNGNSSSSTEYKMNDPESSSVLFNVKQETTNILKDEVDIEDSQIYDSSEKLIVDGQTIQCKYCNFQTKHKNQLWGHMQIHDDSLECRSKDVILYNCSQCKFQSIYKYSITKHLKSHTKIKYKCPKCSFVSVKVEKYNKHVSFCETLPQGLLLECDQCEYRVKTKTLLLIHKKKHKKSSQMLKCEECGLTTMYITALRKHIEKHQREGSKKEFYNCNMCSYKSPSKTMLIRHGKVHINISEVEGKYQCSQCIFQTINLTKLEEHIVEHTDFNSVNKELQMFHCTECSFKTTVMSKVNHHKNLHSRQKNGEIFKCNFCNYETIYKYLLKRHSLKHKDPEDIKMFQCDSCNYKGKTRDYLIRHMRVHQKGGLQQFKCTVCLFQTIYKHSFREHMSRHNISLVDVKKFLNDKADSYEGCSTYVSDQVRDLQTVLSS